MDISKLGLFRMMHTRMAYNSARQDVLSQNIANADTPGFSAHDLKPLDFSKELRDTQHRITLRRTSSMHIDTHKDGQGEFRTEKLRNPYEKKLSENTVNLEEEMMKLSTNSFEYQMATDVYKKTTSLIKTAVGER